MVVSVGIMKQIQQITYGNLVSDGVQTIKHELLCGYELEIESASPTIAFICVKRNDELQTLDFGPWCLEIDVIDITHGSVEDGVRAPRTDHRFVIEILKSYAIVVDDTVIAEIRRPRHQTITIMQ